MWAAWHLVSAIFHRRVDIPFLQQRHLLSTPQHIINLMSMDARACHEASKQAARHEGMQLVSPMYRPWLAPPDCMLTWQQMTAALSWQQIVQVMVCSTYSLSAMHSSHFAGHLPAGYALKLCMFQCHCSNCVVSMSWTSHCISSWSVHLILVLAGMLEPITSFHHNTNLAGVFGFLVLCCICASSHAIAFTGIADVTSVRHLYSVAVILLLARSNLQSPDLVGPSYCGRLRLSFANSSPSHWHMAFAGQCSSSSER